MQNLGVQACCCLSPPSIISCASWLPAEFVVESAGYSHVVGGNPKGSLSSSWVLLWIYPKSVFQVMFLCFFRDCTLILWSYIFTVKVLRIQMQRLGGVVNLIPSKWVRWGGQICVYLKHHIWNLLVSVPIETVLPLMFSTHCSHFEESLGALLYGRRI